MTTGKLIHCSIERTRDYTRVHLAIDVEHVTSEKWADFNKGLLTGLVEGMEIGVSAASQKLPDDAGNGREEGTTPLTVEETDDGTREPDPPTTKPLRSRWGRK